MMPPDPDAEFIAQQFHSVYEALAPYEGYRTRESSAVPWDDVPEVNRRLMVRTVETLLRADVIRQGDNRVDNKKGKVTTR